MTTSLIIVLSIIAILVGYFLFAMYKMKKMPAVADNQHIVKLNDSNFKQQISSGIVLVDFWAEWCMPCKMMAPILNDVAIAAQGKAKVCKLNIDHAKQTAAKFGVRSIPTIIVFKNGKEIKRIVGVKQKAFILSQIEGL